MPLALNDATKFIGPIEAPVYLAGGCRVGSKPISDVMSRFGAIMAVAIASEARGFAAAIRAAMAETDVSDFVAMDDLMAVMSWDNIDDQTTSLLDESQVLRALASQLAPLRAE